VRKKKEKRKRSLFIVSTNIVYPTYFLGACSLRQDDVDIVVGHSVFSVNLYTPLQGTYVTIN